MNIQVIETLIFSLKNNKFPIFVLDEIQSIIHEYHGSPVISSYSFELISSDPQSQSHSDSDSNLNSDEKTLDLLKKEAQIICCSKDNFRKFVVCHHKIYEMKIEPKISTRETKKYRLELFAPNIINYLSRINANNVAFEIYYYCHFPGFILLKLGMCYDNALDDITDDKYLYSLLDIVNNNIFPLEFSDFNRRYKLEPRSFRIENEIYFKSLKPSHVFRLQKEEYYDVDTNLNRSIHVRYRLMYQKITKDIEKIFLAADFINSMRLSRNSQNEEMADLKNYKHHQIYKRYSSYEIYGMENSKRYRKNIGNKNEFKKEFRQQFILTDIEDLALNWMISKDKLRINLNADLFGIVTPQFSFDCIPQDKTSIVKKVNNLDCDHSITLIGDRVLTLNSEIIFQFDFSYIPNSLDFDKCKNLIANIDGIMKLFNFN